ncbi:sulfate permease [Alkalibacter rhizosphaerae]|uniref:Sulfate permease n=2 Tax=Alkalibacter rhizosphaerae TaxID=2815577 RepID=A0A974XPJ0_9FIRM|nr:sulfate permease [Alkalibacter rhizosphaerae]
MDQPLRPKLWTTLKGYTKEQFSKDVTAGILVAIIALPLSIALAISSGVTPEKGLHTAIIAGFLISFLGGSRVQIGGPTGAFMVIVYGIVATHGVDGLILATIMAGLLMILMGWLKLGSVIKFIPYPIITGFTSGIAVTIFSSQIKDFFGLQMESVPVEFIEKWHAYGNAVSTMDPRTMAIGVIALVIIIAWPKVNQKIPGAFVALVITSGLVSLLSLDVATIGSTFGTLTSALPTPRLPHVTFQEIRSLLGPAVTIALLGSVESLLSAVVADGMIGGKHRSNMELVAQGVANIASGLFGGIPATGAIARTVANIKNGGRTPVAGMIHALVLLLILLIFMPLAKSIPLATLSAILIMVAYNMSEWREFVGLFRAPKSDISVLLVTFFITVLFDLVIAIEVGMVLASFLFMKRMADVSHVQMIDLDASEEDPSQDRSALPDINNQEQQKKGIQIYAINGPFFFGATDLFLEAINQLGYKTKILIIDMKSVPAMDGTALHAFEQMIHTCGKREIRVKIAGIQKQPMQVLQKSGLYAELGAEEGFFDSVKEAVVTKGE